MFNDTAELCRGLGRRALLVTGRKAMERLGYAQRLCADLKGQGTDMVRLASISSGPTTNDVDRGAALCRDFGVDFVIALGGGSVIDCAKGIAAVSAGRRPAADYLYGQVSPGQDTLPIVAIPTTSGTGSDLNRSAIITDPGARFKDGIRSDRLSPRLAIVDAILTRSLDRAQTAQSGFDALSHAIESYVSPKARPDTDRLALRAIRLVCRYVPAALADPGDADAREKLALASTTMGINLTCVGTCFPHRADNAGEDSVSILPDLLGTARGPLREATVHQAPGGDLAIRQGPWKLIFLQGGQRELYNLQTDLSEKNDVMGANPEVAERLATLLKKYIADGRSTVGAPQRNEAPMSLDGSARIQKKHKKPKEHSGNEAARALDPAFDGAPAMRRDGSSTTPASMDP